MAKKTVATATANVAADPLDSNPINAFLPVARAVYKMITNARPFKWTDGTISITLANVVLMIGQMDAFFIPDARIVLLNFTNGSKRIELQMPTRSTAGGTVHLPFLKAESGTEDEANFQEWKTAVVNRWLSERREAVKSGAPSLASLMRNTGIAVNDDQMLADLGLTLPKPDAAPSTTTPPPTTTA